MEAFIYIIRHLKTACVYVGSTSNVKTRWREHRYLLEHGTHHSHHLQNSWNKYGADAFDWLIVEECTEQNRYECEQFWIDNLKFNFNHALVAGSRKGVKATPEQCAVISRRFKGIPKTEEHRAKMKLGLKGRRGGMQDRKHTPETRSKIAASHIGIKPNMESRQKMSISARNRSDRNRSSLP